MDAGTKIEADWVYVEALGVETFPPELAEVFPDYSVTPEGVIHYRIQHEAEHRGQIDLLRGLAERAKRDF